MLAAVGIWLPVADDAESRIIKLLISLTLLGAGFFLLSRAGGKPSSSGLPIFVSRRSKLHSRDDVPQFRSGRARAVAPGAAKSGAAWVEDDIETVCDAAEQPIVLTPELRVGGKPAKRKPST